MNYGSLIHGALKGHFCDTTPVRFTKPWAAAGSPLTEHPLHPDSTWNFLFKNHAFSVGLTLSKTYGSDHSHTIPDDVMDNAPGNNPQNSSHSRFFSLRRSLKTNQKT
jgi:hypothetical protein